MTTHIAVVSTERCGRRFKRCPGPPMNSRPRRQPVAIAVASSTTRKHVIHARKFGMEAPDLRPSNAPFPLPVIWLEKKAQWTRLPGHGSERYLCRNNMEPSSDPLDLLEQMIVQQRSKVLELGRKWVPHATEEDLRNPEDFTILKDKPIFHFEDGILSGLVAAKTAIAHSIRSGT